MSLPKAIQNATRTGARVTFLKSDGCPYILNNVTVTATIKNAANGIQRFSSGTFTVLDADDGVFSWVYDPLDVVEVGRFFVQFKIADNTTGFFDYSLPEPWEVLAEQG